MFNIPALINYVPARTYKSYYLLIYGNYEHEVCPKVEITNICDKYTKLNISVNKLDLSPELIGKLFLRTFKENIKDYCHAKENFDTLIKLKILPHNFKFHEYIQKQFGEKYCSNIETIKRKLENACNLTEFTSNWYYSTHTTGLRFLLKGNIKPMLIDLANQNVIIENYEKKKQIW